MFSIMAYNGQRRWQNFGNILFLDFVLSLKKPIMSAIIETVISPDNFPSFGENFFGGEWNLLNWELILFDLCGGPFDLFVAVKNLEIYFF